MILPLPRSTLFPYTTLFRSYSAYWYRSGTNQTMRSHLQGIANVAAEMVGEKKATVLDIGANDGTLLRSYPKGFRKFGDRKSTRLNSSHSQISYAVFCLKKKK